MKTLEKIFAEKLLKIKALGHQAGNHHSIATIARLCLILSCAAS